MSCGGSEGYCELLHVHVNENPQYLVEDGEFDHYILLQPHRVSLKTRLEDLRSTAMEL